jgi:hypothetical protein
MAAESKPPPEVFLKAVDIIGEDDLRQLAKNRKSTPPP